MDSFTALPCIDFDLYNFSMKWTHNGNAEAEKKAEEAAKVYLQRDENFISIYRYGIAPILQDVMEILGGEFVDTDYNLKWCIKPHLRDTWIFTIVAYSIVGFAGIAGNLYMICRVLNELSLRRFINYLLVNVCLADLLKCVAVMPWSLANMLLQHYWWGSVTCRALPMLQTFSLMLSAISYLLISIDRYLVVFQPQSVTNNSVVYAAITISTWILCACLVVPHRVYIEYIDFSEFLPVGAKPRGLCTIDHEYSSLQEFNFVTFILLFVLPIVVIYYLFIKASQELKHRFNANARSSEERLRQLNPRTASNQFNSTAQRSPSPMKMEKSLTVPRGVQASRPDSPEVPVIHTKPPSPQLVHPSPQLAQPSASAISLVPDLVPPQPEGRREGRIISFLNYIDREQAQLSLMTKANKYLSGMVALFVACWAPLTVINLIWTVVPENAEAREISDKMYIALIFFGFSSTVVNPLILFYQRNTLQQTLNMGRRLIRRISSYGNSSIRSNRTNSSRSQHSRGHSRSHSRKLSRKLFGERAGRSRQSLTLSTLIARNNSLREKQAVSSAAQRRTSDQIV